MSKLPIPLDPKAVKAADQEFYAKHPDFVDANGKKTPIHPTEPKHAKAREEWIDLYKKQSNKEDASSQDTAPPDETVNSCPQKVLIYLLFYVTQNDHGDAFFAEAAQTRMQNIKASTGYDASKHKVHCPPIQDLGEIITIVARYIAKYGGEALAFCKEVGVFSHSASDGPIGSKVSSVDPLVPKEYYQMLLSGWGSIKFNWWSEQPLFTAYGCNSANESHGKSFAKSLSVLPNFLNVETWGQSTSSFPSFLPDERVTTIARDIGTGWDVGPTYQVGGNSGDGWKATSPKLSYPTANPMNCYKNGAKVRSTHQGYYNDHRKTFALVTV